MINLYSKIKDLLREVSPRMWLIYINDLMLQLEEFAGINNVFAYADDLMIICETLEKATKLLENGVR